MRFRGTLVLFVLCGALAAFVYFYEIRGGEERSKAEEAANRLWQVETGDVQEVEIASGEERVRAVREGEKQWKITVPRALDADSEEIDRLLGSAAGMRRESVVEAEAADLARYGLDPPQHSFILRTRDGRELAVRFGNNNPTGSSTYGALEGSREVFLVAGYSGSGLQKKLEDLRNRSILRFDQYEAQTLDIRTEKGELRLGKEGDRWYVLGTEKWAADSAEVNAILSALASGRVKEFFDENPEEYAGLGFDRPLADVRATVGKDRAIRHLQVGLPKSALAAKGARAPRPAGGAEASDSGTLYIARDESRSDLFFVDREFVDKLLKSPSDLRNRALAVFQRWDIDAIEVTNAHGTFAFGKSESGGDWLLGEDRRKARWEAVNGVLDALEKAVREFVDSPGALSAYGLESPSISVILRQKGEEKVNCALGRETADGVYALVRGESAVKIADREILERLNKSRDEFLEPPPEPSSPAEEPPKK